MEGTPRGFLADERQPPSPAQCVSAPPRTAVCRARLSPRGKPGRVWEGGTGKPPALGRTQTPENRDRGRCPQARFAGREKPCSVPLDLR